MKVGYARVSTRDQDFESQVASLETAGCERVVVEKASGGEWERSELQELLGDLEDGDTLCVLRLDRLSRSLRDLLRILHRLEESGAGFCSLSESIDTTTPAGRMLAAMLGAFAEFELEMTRTRTRAGLEEARKQGRVGGRPAALTHEQAHTAVELYQSGWSQAKIARTFRVHRSTICRLIARRKT